MNIAWILYAAIRITASHMKYTDALLYPGFERSTRPGLLVSLLDGQGKHESSLPGPNSLSNPDLVYAVGLLLVYEHLRGPLNRGSAARVSVDSRLNSVLALTLRLFIFPK